MIGVKTRAVNTTLESIGMTEWLMIHYPEAQMRILFEPNGNLSDECEFLFETRAAAMHFKLVWG